MAKARVDDRILVEGRNCWRRSHASRAAFLVDAADYFAAFAAAVERAQRSILILGWDIDSRVELRREARSWRHRAALGAFLNAVVSRKRGLHAHVLIWDYAMIYALEREPLPVVKLGWRTHRRLHFRLDGIHPVGASHHQKIVVIDDRIAFVGGIDLTKCRWDTPRHLQVDPHRVDSGCGSYTPFHDVQMLVEGPVAAILGALARERWRRATGETLPAPDIAAGEPWPPEVLPDLEGVEIGIARTEPAYNGSVQVREAEALYLDSIRSARRFLYVENQYLTSTVIAEALAERLSEPDGPELVLVLPRESSGWLEQNTMDALRARLIRELRTADRFDRLRIYYPRLPDSINLHAKVLIADDRLVRVGSSNMSNRSMWLDTECDLAVESRGEARVARAIAGFRNRLIAEHLGVGRETVGEHLSRFGSLIGAIESLRGPGRSLEPLPPQHPEAYERWIMETPLFDPKRPTDAAELIEQMVPREAHQRGHRHLIMLVSVVVLFLAFAAAWQWTPLKHWLNLDLITYWAAYIRGNPLALFIVVLVYTVGGLVVFPVTLLVIATAITFDPVTAFIYSAMGCVASASTLFLAGHLLGREAIDRFAGVRINRMSRQLGERGLLAVITMRIFPIAPYSVVNFVAGASHIRFRDYFLGTIIGLTPGILAITLLGDRIGDAIRHPGWKSFLVLGLLVLFMVVANSLVRRWMCRKGGASADEEC